MGPTGKSDASGDMGQAPSQVEPGSWGWSESPIGDLVLLSDTGCWEGKGGSDESPFLIDVMEFYLFIVRKVPTDCNHTMPGERYGFESSEDQ